MNWDDKIRAIRNLVYLLSGIILLLSLFSVDLTNFLLNIFTAKQGSNYFFETAFFSLGVLLLATFAIALLGPIYTICDALNARGCCAAIDKMRKFFLGFALSSLDMINSAIHAIVWALSLGVLTKVIIGMPGLEVNKEFGLSALFLGSFLVVTAVFDILKK